MHFLLTNDDGINAPGLAALAQAVAAIPGASCTVVAPASEQSQCGHRVTTHEPLQVVRLAANRFTTSGTPADCVRVALFGLGLKPDMVLSGVNAGGNLGQDLYISGTAAGAREAAFHGLPSVAFSHYMVRGIPMDWDRTSEWTRQVLTELLEPALSDGEYWNVNFPHLPPGSRALPDRVASHLCRSPLNVSYQSTPWENDVAWLSYSATYASRPVEPDSDVAICFGGRISVSRLKI